MLRTWVAVVLVICAACTSDDQSSPELLGSSVTGYLLAVPEQPVRLCGTLGGSPPTSCDGDVTAVTGLDITEIGELQELGESRWTATPISLYGTDVDGQLVLPVEARGPAVVGRAVAGPTCPEVRNPPDATCDPISVARAPITILEQDGTVVSTVETDATGRFAVAVAPGTYRVEPGRMPGFLEQGSPVNVVVGDVPVTIEIFYDTGIR